MKQFKGLRIFQIVMTFYFSNPNISLKSRYLYIILFFNGKMIIRYKWNDLNERKLFVKLNENK